MKYGEILASYIKKFILCDLIILIFFFFLLY